MVLNSFLWIMDDTVQEPNQTPDLYVYGGIAVELKAMKHLGNDEYAQILNYLKGTEKRVGYLLNFGSPNELEWKRFVL